MAQAQPILCPPQVRNFRHDNWVLDVIRYPSVERLIEVLEDKIVKRAEAKYN